MFRGMNNKRKSSYCGMFNPMSMRFLQDDDVDASGTEVKAKTDAEAAEAVEAAKAAEAVEEAKRQEDFNKERQRADQEAANAHRAREAGKQAEQQVTELQSEHEKMRSELDELRGKVADQSVDLREEDYEDGDVKLVKAIKGLENKLEANNKLVADKLADLDKTKADILTERKATAAQTARDKIYNELLTDLDEEHGPQHRNAALKAFDVLITEGKVQPSNPTMATRALDKCYKQAKAAAKEDPNKNKDDMPLDRGGGGGSPNLSGVKLKAGSLAEVSAQLRAAATK